MNSLDSRLGNARTSLQIDVGFGDIVVPQPQSITFPVLLGGPAPQLHAYTPETTVAEKLHAMAILGIRNSRMKDFFDLVVMSRTMTFEKRGDQVPPAEPFALTDDFASDFAKQTQWNAFVRREKLELTTNFEKIVREIRRFALNPLRAASMGDAFGKTWDSGGSWKE